MRTEPAVLIAAASPWLNQAINPALRELARARMAMRITATPARAGRELRSQPIIVAGPGKKCSSLTWSVPDEGCCSRPGRTTSKELLAAPFR